MKFSFLPRNGFLARWLGWIPSPTSPRILWALVATYLVASALMTVSEFVTEIGRERERIDAKMQAAGYALDQILGEDFHDRYTPAHPIAPEEYARLVERLNRFARHLGVEYVYSMVMYRGGIRFVTSNETRDDTVRGTPSRFYNPYPSPPRKLIEAFGSTKDGSKLFASYTNIWDSFYSVFIPHDTPKGFRYVLAADIKLRDRHTILAWCALRSTLLVAVLLFPLLPLLLSQRALIRYRDEMAARDRMHLEELERVNQRLEATVASRTKELSQAVLELERFSYTVSHDLNTPLNAISGFAQILQEEVAESLTPSHRDALSRIIAASSRMSSLIKSLLKIATTRHVVPHKTRVDLSQLALEVVAEIRSAGQDHGAAITVQEGVSVLGDPSLIRLILQNLLSNACKYSKNKPAPQVSLRGGCEGDRDWFSVEDNGIGFESELSQRLFQPFGRFHSGLFDGHGIGLSNVARFVENHGGSITAEGRPGEGATFRVTLPRG